MPSPSALNYYNIQVPTLFQLHKALPLPLRQLQDDPLHQGEILSHLEMPVQSEAPLPGQIPVNYIVGAVACNLCRTIDIDIHCIRQRLSPEIQMLHRHNFTAENHFLYLRWYLIFKSFQRCNDAEGGYCPD